MSAPAPAPIIPETPSMPNWMKWAALFCLATAAAMTEAAVDSKGHLKLWDFMRQEFMTLGLVFTGGKISFR